MFLNSAKNLRLLVYAAVFYSLLIFSNGVLAQSSPSLRDCGWHPVQDAAVEQACIDQAQIGFHVVKITSIPPFDPNFLPRRTVHRCFLHTYVYNGMCWDSCPADTEPDGSGKCVTPPKCGENEREWNGECRPLCDAMQTVNQETGDCDCSNKAKPVPSPSVGGPGSIPDFACYGGCQYTTGDLAIGMGGKEWFSDLGTPTGKTCAAGEGDNEKPLPETKEPPCAPGEGVGTSSSGKVLCVPEGTPNAPKPDVQKTVKKETYPDGSEKTTETTKTKDPSTGATDTKSTSTSTGGMAGPAGTTTTTETSTGDGKGTGTEPGQGDGDGDGDCEGDDCGGGEGFKGPEGDLYEKKDRTMKDALEDFSAAVSDSPVMVAARNWFSIGGMPASCGGLSVTVPYLDTTISADSIFCGEYGALIMQIAGAVVLAAAAYAGFRIAIL